MPIRDPLTNPRADRVAAIRALGQRSARARTGQYLAEGPQAVREAIRFAPAAIRDLYLTEVANDRWPELRAEALAAGRFVHPTAPEVMERMSSDAQGVLAVMVAAPRGMADLDLPGARLIAVCEQIRDPGNAGTIIRAGDAIGADAVIFTSGSVEITSPKVVRSSAGSLFHLPVIAGEDLVSVVDGLTASGFGVLAADGAAHHDLETSPLVEGRVAWVFGSEAQGLSQHAREVATATLSIPMAGHAESLNVAMAATIALYETARRQRGSH